MLWKQPNGFFWNSLQMIALVMDSFTDTDIFTDLLEACSQRQVKVYILLDQSSFSHFLKMCKDLGVDLEQEKVSLVIFIGVGTDPLMSVIFELSKEEIIVPAATT